MRLSTVTSLILGAVAGLTAALPVAESESASTSDFPNHIPVTGNFYDADPPTLGLVSITKRQQAEGFYFCVQPDFRGPCSQYVYDDNICRDLTAFPDWDKTISSLTVSADFSCLLFINDDGHCTGDQAHRFTAFDVIAPSLQDWPGLDNAITSFACGKIAAGTKREIGGATDIASIKRGIHAMGVDKPGDNGLASPTQEDKREDARPMLGGSLCSGPDLTGFCIALNGLSGASCVSVPPTTQSLEVDADTYCLLSTSAEAEVECYPWTTPDSVLIGPINWGTLPAGLNKAITAYWCFPWGGNGANAVMGGVDISMLGPGLHDLNITSVQKRSDADVPAEACTEANFNGQCITLSGAAPGDGYCWDLTAMQGMYQSISSFSVPLGWECTFYLNHLCHTNVDSNAFTAFGPSTFSTIPSHFNDKFNSYKCLIVGPE